MKLMGRLFCDCSLRKHKLKGWGGGELSILLFGNTRVMVWLRLGLRFDVGFRFMFRIRINVKIARMLHLCKRM